MPSAAVQAERTVKIISLAYTGIPLLCGVIGIILLVFYRLDREYPMIQKELMERKKSL